MFYHHHCKKLLPCIWPKLTLLQFKTFTLCLNAIDPGGKFVSIFLITPLYVMKGCNKVSPDPPFLQAEQPNTLTLSSQETCSSLWLPSWPLWSIFTQLTLVTMIFPLSSSFIFYQKIHTFLRNSEIFWELTVKSNLQFYCKGYLEGRIIPSASIKQIFCEIGWGKKLFFFQSA